MRPKDNPPVSGFGHPSVASWLPALSAVGRTLRDDPLVANALAMRLDPASHAEDVTAATRRRGTALSILCAHVLAPGSGRTIDLARYLRALCDFERLAVGGAPDVALYANLQPMRVRAETAALLGLAFRELLCNALEHAFPLGGMGHVGIHLWPTSSLPGVRACLLVADDGRGFGAEPPAASECGIPLARHLVERCGGALTREPGGKGTVWRVTLAAVDPKRDAGADEDGPARVERRRARPASAKNHRGLTPATERRPYALLAAPKPRRDQRPDRYGPAAAPRSRSVSGAVVPARPASHRRVNQRERAWPGDLGTRPVL